MEGLDTVRKLIQPGDFMMKLDLQDAYFSVPIHDSYKHYLRFIFQGTTYEFQCLPFGLSSAPWTFTKLLKPVISLLQSRAIRIVIYLDDMLILYQSPNRLASAFHSIVNGLKQLGFLIKQEKCSQVPTQRIEFLGSLINSTDMLQAVPSERLQNIQAECRKAYQNRFMSITELSALLGRMIHCTQMGLAQAPLHYRALQRQHISILRHQKISYQSRTKISLSKDSLTDLQWWISPQIIQFNNTPLTLPAFDMVIYKDAWTQGWGAQYNGILTGGHWAPQESRNHIKSSFFALKHGSHSTSIYRWIGQFYSSCLRQQERRNQVINAGGVSGRAMGSLPSEQHMDNSTTPSWNSECRCGLGLQSLQRTHGMDSGQVNIHTYSKKIYTSQVDLLASRLNHQLPKYVSQHPDPEAMSVDAMHMTLQWNKWTSFIHPPPHSNATSHPEEDSRGPVDLSAHCPKLAGTDMVSTSAAVVDRHPSDFANVGAHNIFTIQPASRASTVANAETRGSCFPGTLWSRRPSTTGGRHTHGLLARWNKEKIRRSLEVMD